MAGNDWNSGISSMQLLIGSIVLGITTALVGFSAGYFASPAEAPQAAAPVTSAPVAPATTPPSSAPSSTAASPEVVEPDATIPHSSVVVVDPVPVGERPPPAVLAELLSPLMVLPTDCPLPLGNPESLPNSDRSYRSGVHQGIDFICGERGRVAAAAAPGRVVFIQAAYEEPLIENRSELLGVAAEAGRTPFWTLAMLYGNHVVIDHGNIEGVGHTVSIYAHLESVDDALRLGATVDAGAPLGLIGNSGTSTGATNGDRPQSLHLHWELHVDELYLAAGLGPSETRSVYETLFSIGQDESG